MLSPDSNLEEAKANLITEIHTAFAGVSREGGVSWRGAQIADAYGYEEVADYIDRDSKWQDLLHDPEWNPEAGFGGWSFLDSISFRYFIPAGMLRSIESGYDVGIVYHLTLNNDRFREWSLNKWSLLDDGQTKCIAHFLHYMSQVERLQDCEYHEPRNFYKALESHWKQFLT